jgi:lipid-binding SYLF domain-containing protein
VTNHVETTGYNRIIANRAGIRSKRHGVWAGQFAALKASEIDRSVTTVLDELYSHNEAAKALGAKAKAVLVVPDVRKAAFIVDAQYGYWALRGGAKTVR